MIVYDEMNRFFSKPPTKNEPKSAAETKQQFRAELQKVAREPPISVKDLVAS